MLLRNHCAHPSHYSAAYAKPSIASASCAAFNLGLFGRRQRKVYPNLHGGLAVQHAGCHLHQEVPGSKPEGSANALD